MWEWLRGTVGGLPVLAVLVGVGVGLGTVAFHWLVVGATVVFSGHVDYAAVPGQPHPWLPGAGRWFVLGVPVLAGLLYGPLLQWLAPEARGHGVSEVMYAVAVQGGRIRPRVAAVKALASALCIGGGGSVGREGPIVQIGAALGSGLGQAVRLPASRLRLLVACGVAGGIAATFNAPIAGVFFALELILIDFAVPAFVAVVLAAVAATVVGRAFLGDHLFLALPALSVDSLVPYLLVAALGVLAGAVGVGFSKVLHIVEDFCDWLWRGPQWLRPAAGGALLGGLLLAVPQLYGVGYPALTRAVDGRYALGFLVVLLVGKVLATSLTIGIGGSGGVFAPSLFIGAMFGETFGQVAHLVVPSAAPSPAAFALVGMGAVFAGSARAPITAVLMTFEFTGQYKLILPLMAAIVLATGCSKLLTADTIYTRKLLRRGIDVHAPERALQRIRVGSAAGRLPQPLAPDTPLREMVDRFAAGGDDALPVVDDQGQFRGVVLATEVQRAISDEAEGNTAATLAMIVPVLRPDQPVEEALLALTRNGGAGLPVGGADGGVCAWITHRDLLRRAVGAHGFHEPAGMPTGLRQPPMAGKWVYQE